VKTMRTGLCTKLNFALSTQKATIEEGGNMSSSGQPGRSRQPNFSTRSTDSSGDKDAPGAGRLARVDNPSDTGTSNLTKGGNVKMKFIPKAVGRKTAEYITSLMTFH
jgi:hypothetical protein